MKAFLPQKQKTTYHNQNFQEPKLSPTMMLIRQNSLEFIFYLLEMLVFLCDIISYNVNMTSLTLFLVVLFRAGFFHPQLNLRQLIQPDLESYYKFTSQLGPSIQPGSPCAGQLVVTQSTHLQKDCYPQLVLNSNHSEIRPPKQLDHRCILLHLA